MPKARLVRSHWSEDNEVHIKPNGSHDPCETLCGNVDNMDTTYTPTNKAVSCCQCLHEFEALKDGLVLVKV